MIYKIDHFFGNIFNNLHLWGGNVLDWIMVGISYLAEAGILFLLIGFGLALFKKTRKVGACILFAVAIGFVFTNVILKNTVSRPRPFSEISSDFYKWWLEVGAHHESGYSFPSGHTTATTAFTLAIFLTADKKRVWWILFLPIIMACSRMYLMVHYFTDCLGGLVVGSVSAVIAYLIVKWIYSSNIKLFVWAREFNVFKPNQKINKPATQSKNKQSINTNNNKTEDFVYLTQEQEMTLKGKPVETDLSKVETNENIEANKPDNDKQGKK